MVIKLNDLSSIQISTMSAYMAVSVLVMAKFRQRISKDIALTAIGILFSPLWRVFFLFSIALSFDIWLEPSTLLVSSNLR